MDEDDVENGEDIELVEMESGIVWGRRRKVYIFPVSNFGFLEEEGEIEEFGTKFIDGGEMFGENGREFGGE